MSGLRASCRGHAELALSALGVSLLKISGAVEIDLAESSVHLELRQDGDGIALAELRPEIVVSHVRMGKHQIPNLLLSLSRDILNEVTSRIGKRMFNEVVAGTMKKIIDSSRSPLPPFFDSPNPPIDTLNLSRSVLKTVTEISSKIQPIIARLGPALRGKTLSGSTLPISGPFKMTVPMTGLGNACVYVTCTSILVNEMDPVSLLMQTPLPFDLNVQVKSAGIFDVTSSMLVILSSSYGPTIGLNMSMNIRSSNARVDLVS